MYIRETCTGMPPDGCKKWVILNFLIFVFFFSKVDMANSNINNIVLNILVNNNNNLTFSSKIFIIYNTTIFFIIFLNNKNKYIKKFYYEE